MPQLSERGIATAIHYPHSCHINRRTPTWVIVAVTFPVAEDVASRCLSLPMFPELTVEQLFYVAEAIKECVECDVSAGSHGFAWKWIFATGQCWLRVAAD